MTYLTLILSALLTSLTLRYDLLWPLSFFSMAPLIYELIRAIEEKKRYRNLYAKALLWSMVYYMTAYVFFWRMYPMEFLGLNRLSGFFVAAFCQIGLSLLQALPTALTAPLLGLLYRHRKLAPLLFASLWTIFEWLQNFTWAGVPFVRLALSQTAVLPAMQSASLFGSLFLSFGVVLVNGCMGIGAYYLHINGRHCKAVRMFPILGASLIFLNLGLGLLLLGSYSEDDGDRIPVALIQGNIGADDKWSGNPQSTFDIYFELTRQAAESGAELILLPETALNFELLSTYYSGYAEMFRELADSYGCTIFLGTFTTETSEDEILYRNSLVGLTPGEGYEREPYHKRRLVPFGEFLPMESLFDRVLPFLTELNLFSDPLTPGDGPVIVDSSYGQIGRLICFDSIYENLTLATVRDGAEIILLSTNDSWYFDSSAVYMHRDHAKLRAVESGRYLLRAANTGISSIITPLGETSAELAALQKGIVLGSALSRSERTLYSMIGDLIILGCFTVLAFEGGWKLRERILAIRASKGQPPDRSGNFTGSGVG